MTATHEHTTYPIRQRAIAALLADPEWFVVLPDDEPEPTQFDVQPYALCGGDTFELLPVAGGWRWIRVELDEQYADDGPTCSICDGLGHGYPGAGPCPLEDRGWDDDDDRFRSTSTRMWEGTREPW
jgi:hypothetical protein